MKRIVLTIQGHVQGVGFRYSASQYAQKLGLVGYVMNKPEGVVFVVAEGNQENLHKLLEFCYNGVSGAEVTNIDYDWYDASGEFQGFEVRQ